MQRFQVVRFGFEGAHFEPPFWLRHIRLSPQKDLVANSLRDWKLKFKNERYRTASQPKLRGHGACPVSTGG